LNAVTRNATFIYVGYSRAQRARTLEEEAEDKSCLSIPPPHL